MEETPGNVMTLAVGRRLQDRYALQSVLAEGGMSQVYLALDERFGRQVAVKIMTVEVQSEAERQEAIAQFKREAQILSTLDHPGLVPVHDYFIEDDNHCLVMAYIKGRTLEQVQNATSLPLVLVLHWMDDLAAVCEYLHAHHPPIVFRDLKPSNVMLDPNGRVRLIDFGIALVGTRQDAGLLEVTGTHGYAPIEQYGEGEVDGRADVYGLGATAYCLLTQTVPPAAVSLLVHEEELELPRELNAEISAELEAVLVRMLSVERQDRHASMAEVREALRLLPEYRSQDDFSLRKVKRCSHCGMALLPEEVCGQCAAPEPAAPPPEPEPVVRVLLPHRVGLLVASGQAELLDCVEAAAQGDFPIVLAQAVGLPGADGADWSGLGLVDVTPRGDAVQFYGDVSLDLGLWGAAQEAVERARELCEWGGRQSAGAREGTLLFLVPGGPCEMGEPARRHTVTVSPFYLGRYPVTNRQYQEFLSDTGREPPPRWRSYLEKCGPDVPTALVSWFDALAYVTWAGGRLPTAAEWEMAAGGGDGRRWPWGDDFRGDHCYIGRPGRRPGPVFVGRFPQGRSPSGCEDMIGNVWEWCSSKFRPYPYVRGDGREALTGDEPREIRGGSWRNPDPGRLGISVRDGVQPDMPYDNIGFRLAASVTAVTI
ncbi:MAG TPA: bifunctional serine/threonine-protein kinase/formylglycine-generating enzyme family protein [Candidatus Xenobia bacterium]|jgi:formylglycine-generating enzyme required for sulfatase activity/tRNA A-37 threonylcarbamoyl transferase component Bud32